MVFAFFCHVRLANSSQSAQRTLVEASILLCQQVTGGLIARVRLHSLQSSQDFYKIV